MPVEDENGKVFERIIKIDDIETKPYSGGEFILITDIAGNEFSSFEESWKDKLQEQEDRYVGEVWKIQFVLNDKDYLNFEALLKPDDDVDPLREPIDKEQLKREKLEHAGEEVNENDLQHELKNVPKQVKMNRLGVAKAVAPIVAAEIQRGHLTGTDDFQSGAEVEDVDEAIRERLEYWTNAMFTYANTGSFIEEE